MPAIGLRIARAPAFASLLVFTSLTGAGVDGWPLTQVAAANKKAPSHPHLAAPDQPGPFHVGVMVFSATMSGGRTTRVQLFYPTAEPVECATRYRITFLAGSYDLQSPLCARPNARAWPGSFPLVVHDHGGVGPGPDLQRVAQLPLYETMASHGFVTAVALHAADPVVRVRDLTLVIDAQLALNATSGDPLAGSIVPARIGISGISAGASAAIGAAGGLEDHGVLADTRIKAMILYEPGLEYSLDDASRIAIPYLIMGGSQSQSGLAIPALFAATVQAVPRIYVLNPSATHFSYVTGLCSEIEQTREAALLADPTLPEPLTNRSATNPAAARAFDQWNIGQILFGLLGPGTGSGRNFCNRTGVDSVRPLDASPQDGFTDSPPFLSTDGFTLTPVIPDEILGPQITLHTVAFWKTFLQGDHRYRPYLTRGYARSHGLKAEVFTIGKGDEDR
jgi:predicted dienelactone hydrolase